MKPINTLHTLICCIFFIAFNDQLEAQCDASFSYTEIGNTVNFTSTNPNPYRSDEWFFGDGNTGYGYNTSHAYTEPGTYTVTHIVSDSSNTCIDSVKESVTVNFTFSCAVDFSYYNNIYDSTHNITDSSLYQFVAYPQLVGSSVQSYLWTVDGIVMSTERSFDYSFPNGGNHTVCVQIQTADGCVSQSCQTLNVFSPCNINPSFTYSFTDSSNIRLVKFIGYPQLPGAQYLWQFTNNSNYLQGDTAEYQYSSGGNYPVHLQIIDSAEMCSASVIQTIALPVSACDTAKVSFSYVSDSVNNEKIYFTLYSNEPVQSQEWRICPSSQSDCVDSIYVNAPTYTFPNPGSADTANYIVCVNVTTTEGCFEQYCGGITINDTAQTPRPDNIGAKILAYPNPVNNIVNLKAILTEAGNITVNIYNSSGVKVATFQVQGSSGSNVIQIPVTQLQSGIYYIDININGQHVKSVFQKI